MRNQRRPIRLLTLLLALACLAPRVDAANDLEGAASHALQIDVGMVTDIMGPRLEFVASVANVGDLTLKEVTVTASAPKGIQLSGAPVTFARLAPGEHRVVPMDATCQGPTDRIAPVAIRARDAKGWVASEVLVGIQANRIANEIVAFAVEGPSRRLFLYGRPRGRVRAGRPFAVDLYVGWHGWVPGDATVNVAAPASFQLESGTERTEVYPLAGSEKDRRGSPTKTVTLTYRCDVPGRYRLRANASDPQGLYRAGALIDVEVFPANAGEPTPSPHGPQAPIPASGPQAVVRIGGIEGIQVSRAEASDRTRAAPVGDVSVWVDGSLEGDDLQELRGLLEKATARPAGQPASLRIEADPLTGWGAIAWVLRIATEPSVGARGVEFIDEDGGPPARFALHRVRVRDALLERLPLSAPSPHRVPLVVRFDEEDREIVLQESVVLRLPSAGKGLAPEWSAGDPEFDHVGPDLGVLVTRVRHQVEAGEQSAPLRSCAWIRWTSNNGLKAWSDMPYGHVLVALRVLEAKAFTSVAFDHPRLPWDSLKSASSAEFE